MTLEEIEKLCEEATPGPWHYDNGLGDYVHTGENSEVMDGMICQVRGAGAGYDLNINGEFIAASRTLIPKLLAVIKAAKIAISESDIPEDIDWCHFNNFLMACNELEKE